MTQTSRLVTFSGFLLLTIISGALIAGVFSLCWGSDGWGGPLEDFLLENKQITIDQWVRLKAEEERRDAKAMEQSRGISDVPVKERWYEKISIRGYTQLRYNFTPDNDLLSNSLGDRSIGKNNEFFMRRARLIVSGQPHDRVFVYLQGEFAGLVDNSEGTTVLRDAYADLFLTENKTWRIRAGLSKVPFSFENLQSSQNRLALDRTDPMNSAFPGERNLGVFLYYTPTTVRERFRRLVDSGLKGSGDYGMVGIGVINGQAANKRDANKNKHVVFHSSYPHEFSNGQIVEARRRSNQPHGRKERAHAARVASEQRQMSHVSVRADEEIRERSSLFPACAPVFLEGFAGLKSRRQRQGQTGESGKPVLQLFLCVELHGQFGRTFQRLSSFTELHQTPGGAEQEFVYCYCRWAG